MQITAPGKVPHRGALPQIMLVMRLVAILMLATCLQVSARGYTQGRVNLTLKNAPLETALKAIMKQSGYYYWGDPALLKRAKPVNVALRDAEVRAALDECFRDQPLTYEIEDRIVVVKEVVASSASIVPNAEPLSEVRGRVMDEKGEPLVGASVVVKGTKIGTVTDSKGNFELSNVSNGAVLVLSYTGYLSREIVLRGGGQDMVIRLIVSNSPLDEVEVIAYGTTTQRFTTGNISEVKGEDIARQPVGNPLLALEGRVPGLFITQNTGVPGGGVTVRIQGQNSIQRGNDPLYVIDGIPYNSQIPSTGLGNNILGNSGNYSTGNIQINGVGNPLSYINPLDIASIEVLKDADATAIYGSRAANGAILITTKKGVAGSMKVDFNLQQGFGKVTRSMKMMNTRQYLDMRYEALKNDGINLSAQSKTNANYYDLLFWDTTRYTNWAKTLIGNTAQYTNVNGSVSGGTNTIQYFLDGTYHRETTVFPGDFSDQKASLHLNISGASSKQKFHFQLTGSYLYDDNQLPQTDLTNIAMLLEPDAPPLYNSDGSINWAQTATGNSSFDHNPMAKLYNTYRNDAGNLMSNLLLVYRLLPGLDVQSNIGYTNMHSKEFTASPLVAIQPEYRTNIPRSANYGASDIYTWIVEPQIHYVKKILKGKLESLLGATIQQNGSNGYSIEGVGYNSDNVLENIQDATALSATSVFQSEYKYGAVFGRINYDWQDKYIINLNGRRDGSSRFGENNQFHEFGSVGAGWIFSREKFIQNDLPFLSFGKLRASYGTTGNDQIGDYAFMNLYSAVYASVPYQGAVGLAPTGLANPYLEWEETQKASLGGDFGILRDRLLLNVTFERNRSSNELLNYALPNITGFGTITKNFPATVQNTSWELNLNSTNVNVKGFTWTTGLNLTIPRNKLISFPNLSTSTYAKSLVIGQPVNIQHELHFLGVNPATGLYIAADSHGNPTSTPNYSTDRTVTVSTFPKFYGGLQNSLQFKGFQLDFIFQFTKQRAYAYKFGNGYKYPGQFFRSQSNQPVSVLNPWQKPGDNASIQRYSTKLTGLVAASSDAVYADASYIRLRNLSLSYQFPDKWVQKGRFRYFRMYMQGQNLWTITHYQGMDPENQGNSALPPLQIWTLGIQLGL
ncbi:SusC/RagA family TonB-linked outer membrane protein [Dinghuibacter silviterrae]|uniref:TonB-linked SusC/RagA family outer membrane protein n=1 Tax=Dinghuibacter silviterrae TaxID=1539049 RepID=A0A4R8DVA5_9BACT|nr:SusC/RagA family TonB-linked outer membrane protein [Dinghuibacter silviterrae]TDX01848.1 TonB-linked SusC/RagA family outer membrane protein [Dinghuibacter silviterrae]